jgi:predicted DNA-binding ribbon-helix-helix protein
MSLVKKHSVTIRGHRTSFSLETEFMRELELIAKERGTKFAQLVAEIDENRPRDTNLSSALRLFVLEQIRKHSASAGY